jgi:hypothetical protein
MLRQEDFEAELGPEEQSKLDRAVESNEPQSDIVVDNLELNVPPGDEDVNFDFSDIEGSDEEITALIG